MKNSPYKKPDIEPIPRTNPIEPTPQTNPIKPIIPEVVPEIKKIDPVVPIPEIKPGIRPEISK